MTSAAKKVASTATEEEDHNYSTRTSILCVRSRARSLNVDCAFVRCLCCATGRQKAATVQLSKRTIDDDDRHATPSANSKAVLFSRIEFLNVYQPRNHRFFAR
jgi:hypothetical protein